MSQLSDIYLSRSSGSYGINLSYLLSSESICCLHFKVFILCSWICKLLDPVEYGDMAMWHLVSSLSTPPKCSNQASPEISLLNIQSQSIILMILFMYHGTHKNQSLSPESVLQSQKQSRETIVCNYCVPFLSPTIATLSNFVFGCGRVF